MKENLILKKFVKEPVNGTFNLLEEISFFSAKIMDIEDDISITDLSVQYFQEWYQVTDPNDPVQQELSKNNGYQFYELNLFEEDLFILDTVALKFDHHTITKMQQNDLDNKYNTRWEIIVDIKSILREYLFAKIKEQRTFKSLKYSNFMNNNINESIRQYINLNLLDRYKFNGVDLYINYIDIKNNSVYNNLTLKQYDPVYDSSIELPENLVANANVQINNYIDPISTVRITYFQTMPSTNYKFEYYFNIKYQKI
jgi:hypothetical protein